MTTTLQPPGAGLPRIELLFVRFFFRLFLLSATSRKLRMKLNSERRLIADLLSQFSEDEQRKQTLIPRIGGIEDSSRNWSVLMTLQHLVITTTGMTRISAALARGSNAGLPEVKIEAVKPSPDVAPTVTKEFWQAVDELEQYLGGLSSEKGGLSHPHPWFGPLTSHGWACLAVLHLGIHRRQLAMIRALVGRES